MRLIIFGLVLCSVLMVAYSQKKMVCYYGTWAVYRPGNGKFDVEDIDINLCTHIIYGFTGLGTDNTIKCLDPWNDLYDGGGKGALYRFTGLKNRKPTLKALVAIGGWNEGSEQYSKMVSDPAKRSVFVTSVVNFIKKYGFDGLDFDWEYPANRGGIPSDKQNFIFMIQELKNAFAPYGWILTAAVSPGKSTIDSAYDIPSLANILDQVHVMAYDYHGAWEPYTGLNSPLFSNNLVDKGSDNILNVNWTINYWISNGVPPSKIIYGMPLYGRGFVLDNPSVNGFYAPAALPIPDGPYTRQNGTWGYNEICEKFKYESGWTVVRDSCYISPYAVKGNLWIGYDDQQSLRAKAQMIAAMNLGGALIWDMDTDDFRGLCHGTTFVLTKTIIDAMNGPTNLMPSPSYPCRTDVSTTPTTTVTPPSTKKKMVCYYGTWAVYRPGNGKFDVEDIDTNLCTHIIYGFTGLGTDNTIKCLDPWNDLYDGGGKGALYRFTGLKSRNPSMKALVAIGGWNEGSESYSRMVSDPAKRSVFVTSVVNFIKKYGFDGLDFDWEYPANRGGIPSDKQNFIFMIQELKNAFAPYGWMLTAAVSPGKSTIDSAYDIPALANILDQVHVMAYDYHGAWEPYTGLNSPLFSNPYVDKGSDNILNAEWTINYWISNGVPQSKIIFGMPLYGRGFVLDNPSVNGFYAPAALPIPDGPYTRQNGTWGYNEICEKFKYEIGWTVVRDSCYQSPYAFKGSLWIGYDDQQSLRTKGKMIAAMNLGGALIWDMDTDDFRGLCHGTTFVLTKTIIDAMNGPTNLMPTNPCATTTTKTTTTTTSITTPTTTTPTTTTSTTTTPTTTTSTTTTPTTTTPTTTTSTTTTPTTTTPTTTTPTTTTSTTTTPTTTTSTTTTPTTTTPTTTTPITTRTSTTTTSTTTPTTTSTATPTTTTSTTTRTTIPTTTTQTTTTSTTTRTTTPTTPSTQSTTTTKNTTISTVHPPSYYCKREGYNADPDDCGIFHQCVYYTETGWQDFVQPCAPGTVFSESMHTCAQPELVPGCEFYYETKTRH